MSWRPGRRLKNILETREETKSILWSREGMQSVDQGMIAICVAQDPMSLTFVHLFANHSFLWISGQMKYIQIWIHDIRGLCLTKFLVFALLNSKLSSSFSWMGLHLWAGFCKSWIFVKACIMLNARYIIRARMIWL